MDLPAGKKQGQTFSLEKEPIEKKIANLMKQSFNGYLALTIFSQNKPIESILFFKNGFIEGCLFTYNSFTEEELGDNAIKDCLASIKTEQGVYDIIELTKQQTELTLALKEKFVLTKKLNYLEFSRELKKAKIIKTKSTKINKKPISRLEALKKLGLGSI